MAIFTYAKEEEVPLTGQVQGEPAAEGEERLARAFDKHEGVRSYQFRLAVGAPRGQPGWKELDFLVVTVYGHVAVEVDDMSFVHLGKGSETQMEDAQRITGLAEKGVVVMSIDHVDNKDLLTQEGADVVSRELI